MTNFIHPKAHVEGAEIGEGAKVFQFATIIRGARIGAGTSIGPCAMIDGSWIGEDCRVCYGVNMGPGFLIGNGVFLGPEVVLCNDRWPRADKRSFDASVFDGTRWAVIIEDGASLGVRATVMPGVRIGRNAMIAAHAVVTRDVPDWHIYYPDGHMEAIEPEREEAQISRRMKMAKPACRAFGGESLPHVRALEMEQEGILRDVGFRDDEIAALTV